MATPVTVAREQSLTIEQLLELHPWPREWRDARRIERLWIYDLPATPEALWPWISDTSRMNRALGTAEMTFREHNGVRHGAAKPGGVRHEWVEVPWNWVANQWLTSLRIYQRGFFRAVWAIHRLEPVDGGTKLYIYFGTVPRNRLAGAAIRIGFPSIEKAYRRVLPALARQLDAARPAVLSLPPPELAESAIERLAAQRTALVARGLPARSVDPLIDWIRTGDPMDLHRIQIRERARVWKVDEDELLRVALHATRAGLLTLSWDTICPHCRGVRDENTTLSALAASSECEACKVTFTTDTPESVEVTFRVHPSIREIADQVYCSAEPAKKSHIRLQRELAAGASEQVLLRLAGGRYRMCRNDAPVWYLDVDDAGAQDVPWQSQSEGAVVRARSDATIALTNPTDHPLTFAITEAQWGDHALRAGQLLSFQEFRDLFSEEYIGADVRLGVGEQTLLFTDVVGSTAFYAERGDPAAFIEIKRHFDEVFAIVREFRGAVVKTIGDAVMATFVDPVDSVKASKKIHDTFHPARRDTPIRLRISLNTGPCIAVRLNANADFFGGTVNIAAKLQALAEGYQIAISEATYRAPGVQRYLEDQGAPLEQLSYTSKALSAPVGVWRWSVYRE